jgi:hypothetical protein
MSPVAPHSACLPRRQRRRLRAKGLTRAAPPRDASRRGVAPEHPRGRSSSDPKRRGRVGNRVPRRSGPPWSPTSIHSRQGSTSSTRRAGSRSSSTCEARHYFSASRCSLSELETQPFAASCERFSFRANSDLASRLDGLARLYFVRGHAPTARVASLDRFANSETGSSDSTGQGSGSVEEALHFLARTEISPDACGRLP